MIRKADSGTYVVSADELDIKHVYSNEACSTCPLCRDTREHPEDASLKINVTTGAGFCHHCHESVFVPDFANETKVEPQKVSPVKDKCFTDGITLLDDVCSDYLEYRNIDPKIAVEAGVGSKVINGIHYLAFTFMENGAAVNVQYKRADAKNKEFKFESGGKIIPWNIDCLSDGDGKSPLYITEGMMDALALIQSGYRNVISVPNGSGSRMEVFDAYRAVIKKNFSHIVFAGDTDKAGVELRNKVKTYFSGTEVSVVNWHWADCNCKDANGMLLCGGAECVAFCIENAVYDDCGLLDVMYSDDKEVLNVFEKGLPEGRGIGLKSIDSLLKFMLGYVYIVSGYPGAGKSSFVNFITMTLLKLYGWRSLFFSPEKMPKTNHRIEFVSVVAGKKFDKKVMGKDDVRIAMNFLSGNVVQMRDGVNRDLDTILKSTEIAIRRYGIKVLVIDPFMYIDIDRLNGMSESYRIMQMLCKIHMFAQKNHIMVIIVAHPRKPNANARSPGLSELLYEVAGSSSFYNFCDAGVVLRRVSEKSNRVEVKCGKSRFSYLGKMGITKLVYNPENGRYSECSQFGTA